MSNPAFMGDDYEFVAGHVMGLRSWQADAEGRLVGVTYPAIWKPGENVSECYADPQVGKCPSSTATEWYNEKHCDYGNCDGVWHYRDEHHYDRNCNCGYWAYNEKNFSPDGTITGVIKGYGKTTIGPRGFRCEKAEVMALSRSAMTMSLWLRLKKLYPDVEFYEERDAMIEDFPEVCKSFGEVGEDFWEQKKEIQNIRAMAGGFVTFGSLSVSMDPSMPNQAMRLVTGQSATGKTVVNGGVLSIPNALIPEPPKPPRGIREKKKPWWKP